MKVFEPLAGKVLVDGTLGGGGHTRALLAAGAKRVIGIDRDASALGRVEEVEGLTKVSGNFREIGMLLDSLGVDTVDGVLVDLGYSSDQMDDPARGFGYANDGPLDMRMNRERGKTAAELVNSLPEEELAKLFFEYGEEPRSRALARKLVTLRKEAPVETTGQLLKVIEEVYPPRMGLARSHPAARLFQALRVAVNGELDDLAAFIPAAVARLAPGGRLAIITFNSLEDRMVKGAFKTLAQDELDSVGRVARDAPFKAWKKIEPQQREIEENRRSRSAKVRVLERL